MTRMSSKQLKAKEVKKKVTETNFRPLPYERHIVMRYCAQCNTKRPYYDLGYEYGVGDVCIEGKGCK